MEPFSREVLAAFAVVIVVVPVAVLIVLPMLYVSTAAIRDRNYLKSGLAILWSNATFFVAILMII